MCKLHALLAKAGWTACLGSVSPQRLATVVGCALISSSACLYVTACNIVCSHRASANTVSFVAGPNGTGLIQNKGGVYAEENGGGSISAGASEGVSDDQYADSGMYANGGDNHEMSRLGRSAPMLHERMQSTNSSSPVDREVEDGVDEEQSFTSDTQ